MKKQPSASLFEQGIVHRGTYARRLVDDDFIEKYNNNCSQSIHSILFQK